MDTKTCPKCRRDLPATPDYFYRCRKQRSGLYTRCKQCCYIDQSLGYEKKETKFCSSCKQEKPATRESFSASRASRDGLHNQCKRCRHNEVKRNYHSNNKDDRNAYVRQYQARLRAEVLNHYGKGHPACVCCGEDHIEFLVLDHVNGGGNAHRKELGNGKSCTSAVLYHWVRRHGYPDDFRILCDNCNSSYGRYGYCPHRQHQEVD